MPDWSAVNDEVYYAAQQPCVVDANQIAQLKAIAARNASKKARLCTHASSDALHHDMLIVHHRDIYVPPHRHTAKDESLHIIEGDALGIVFTMEGNIKQVKKLSVVGGGYDFYMRIPQGTYHSLVILSEWLVFHETTTGPFMRDETQFALWAPSDGDSQSAIAAYQESIIKAYHQT